MFNRIFKMEKRLRYPEHFNTKREMLWYIRGLMDKKKTINEALELEINRYRDSISFTEFKWDENPTKHNTRLKKERVLDKK